MVVDDSKEDSSWADDVKEAFGKGCIVYLRYNVTRRVLYDRNL